MTGRENRIEKTLQELPTAINLYRTMEMTSWLHKRRTRAHINFCATRLPNLEDPAWADLIEKRQGLLMRSGAATAGLLKPLLL